MCIEMPTSIQVSKGIPNLSDIMLYCIELRLHFADLFKIIRAIVSLSVTAFYLEQEINASRGYSAMLPSVCCI